MKKRLICLLSLIVGALITLGVLAFFPASWMSANCLPDEQVETGTGNQAGTGTEVQIPEEEVSILTNSGVITPDIIQAIKTDAFVVGSGNPILWIEYSDLQCPYCKEIHNADNVSKLINEDLEGNVDFVWKHYPKSFHTEALPAHQVLECLAEQKGQDAFYAAIDQVFKSEDVVNPEMMEEIVANLGGDQEAIDACVASGKYREKIFNHIGEAVGVFNATKVPSTVIINTENGKWISYVGDEPAEKVSLELEHLK